MSPLSSQTAYWKEQKQPFAYFARVGSFSSVNPHVNGQLTPLVEPCAALVTAVGLVLLVLGVGSHVIPDVTLERLLADVALVETFVLVKRQDVTFKRVGARVGLVAEVALVLARADVKLHVRLQVAARIELEVAGRARVWFVAGVGPLVDEQLPAAGKRLSAVVAVVRLLAGVRSTVKAEAFLDREALVADVALVRHLAGVGAHVDRQTSDLDELNEN